jgi:hypothetical protein
MRERLGATDDATAVAASTRRAARERGFDFDDRDFRRIARLIREHAGIHLGRTSATWPMDAWPVACARWAATLPDYLDLLEADRTPNCRRSSTR